LAQNNDDDLPYPQKLRLDISHPGDIPNFNDFETPTIVPGKTGPLRFTITNRYDFEDDNTLNDVTLIVNIYTYVTLETQKNMNDISNAPQIVGGNSAFQRTIDKWTAEFHWAQILEDETVPVELKIKSFTNTPEGRYFVRMHLNFSFNGTYFDMKSRGHFSNSMWDRASMNITVQGDPEYVPNATDPYHKLEAGRLNLEELDVDGVIPETSIRVLNPLPQWPLYLFIGLAAFFVVMAVVFYLMDEKGKFPKAKRKLDNFGRKMRGFREKRK
jgi:hypothetical protein